MRRFAFVLLIVAYFVKSDSDCPSNVVCTSTLNRHSCPAGKYFREKEKSNNCCPDCIPLKDLNENCKTSEECAPGLLCSHGSLICKDDETQKCDHYKRNDQIWTRTRYWEPDCLPDGKYAAKQCKGEKLSGKCFCTNEDGVRISGEAPWIAAENMTCACSRLAEKLMTIHKDLSLHCDELGNYEALQCNNGICWCANERTGIPYTPIVPESMTRILPCFEEENFGSKYLRQCDSIRVHTERAIKILKNHGLRSIILPKENCNFDGSFARVQLEGTRQYCVYKNKHKISFPSEGKKDCNCAYDKFVAENILDKFFNFECDNLGSYNPVQGGNAFRVDSDGFIYENVEN